MLAFAATLTAAVLISGLAQRSVLSTAALFLVAGFVTGAIPSIPSALPQPVSGYRPPKRPPRWRNCSA